MNPAIILFTTMFAICFVLSIVICRRWFKQHAEEIQYITATTQYDSWDNAQERVTKRLIENLAGMFVAWLTIIIFSIYYFTNL